MTKDTKKRIEAAIERGHDFAAQQIEGGVRKMVDDSYSIQAFTSLLANVEAYLEQVQRLEQLIAFTGE